MGVASTKVTHRYIEASSLSWQRAGLEVTVTLVHDYTTLHYITLLYTTLH